MKTILKIIALLLVLTSCDKEIVIKPKEKTDLLVVEGHIEPGLPPYILLTKTQPFFSSTDLNTINNLFISNAEVKVSDGVNTAILTEFSSDSLPDFLIDTIADRLGITLASRSNPNGLRIKVYTTLNLIGQVGNTYSLEVNAQGQQLTASTTIPAAKALDSLWAVPHPVNDTLATLYVRYSDPPGEKNFVRYFTSVGRNPFFPPYFNSVLDDRTLLNVDGKTFDFPVEKGHYRYEGIDYSTYTYFAKGDSVTLRWCTIDEAHYKYWSTAEFDRNSGGNPFSNPTVVKTNIKGGLGIWGGYSPSYHFIVIP